MNIPRIYHDTLGKSHFGERSIATPHTSPLGLLSQRFASNDLIFRESPADYAFEWHPAPQRQLMFILKGRCEFKVSSGETRQFGAGDVLLLEDTQGQGHCSKALFNEVRHSIFITLPDDVLISDTEA